MSQDPIFEKGDLSLFATYDGGQVVKVQLEAGGVVAATITYSSDARNVQVELQEFASHNDQMLNILPLLGDSLRPHLRALLEKRALRVSRVGNRLAAYALVGEPQSVNAIKASLQANELAFIEEQEPGNFNGDGEDPIIDVLTTLHFVAL